MMRSAFIAGLLLVAGSATAQTPSMAEQAWGFVKSSWATAQKEGKVAADRFVRQFPEKFKNVPKDAKNFMARWEKQIAALDLDDRKRLALELWRIRGSLNLLALASPSTLRMIGVEAGPLQDLATGFTKVSEGLIKKWPELKRP